MDLRQTTQDPMRLHEPPEDLEGFKGHSGTCTHCGGVVKMIRNMESPHQLLPDRCGCIQCGQGYRVKVEGDIWDFDAEQWRQKAAGIRGHAYKMDVSELIEAQDKRRTTVHKP